MVDTDQRFAQDPKDTGAIFKLLNSAFERMWQEVHRRDLTAPFEIQITDHDGDEIYHAVYDEDPEGALSGTVVSPARDEYDARYPIVLVLTDGRDRSIEIIIDEPRGNFIQ